ncbi:MAG: hypothetical protein J6386_12085 [Candidatus Synoicihabitans palmerolidicus]|nr:hypothetical protein [Candidatus Synoicihabitans palmerolidicus]
MCVFISASVCSSSVAKSARRRLKAFTQNASGQLAPVACGDELITDLPAIVEQLTQGCGRFVEGTVQAWLHL